MIDVSQLLEALIQAGVPAPLVAQVALMGAELTSFREKRSKPHKAKCDINGTSVDDFDKFWLAYPKRKGSNPKAPARVRFEKVVREGADPVALIAGACAYANFEHANVGTPYIAQAVTWLNQRRWEDYRPEASTVSPEEAERLIAQYHRRRLEANGGGS